MNKQIKIYALVFFATHLFFYGCSPSSVITLRNSPSDVVLTSIEPVNKEIEYEIKSKVQDPYSYLNDAGFEFIIPINNPYNFHINSFISTKYMGNSSDNLSGSSKIIFELDSFEVEYENIQNVDDFLIGSGDANVKAFIVSNVTVFENDKIIGERKISTNSQFNERIRGNTRVQDVYQKASNDVLNSHIIMINNFIKSLDL